MMKQTEIGLIPDDWEVKEIKDFADVTTGDKNTQDAEENGKYPFYVRSPIVERINKFSYDTEGVITAGDGVGTGKVFHYAKGKFGLHQRAYLIYNFKNTDPKYFYYNFSKNFYERVHSMTAKSSVDSVRREMITKMQIPIPPTLAEQQRIAKALSDVDALISTTEKLIQKKKNIKQGTMQNLLAGKKRLPGFGPQTKSPTYKQTELGPIPEDWEVKNIGTTCNVITGGEAPVVYSKDKNTLYKYPIYSNGKEVYGYHASYTIDHDAVCISSIGENTGDIFYYQKNFTPIIRLKVIIPKKSNIDTEFLYYCLKTIKIDTTKNGGIPNINSNDVKSINYIQPTSKEEQTAIANVLSSMDKEIETLNTKLEKYRNLKTAMMQQLLTGKIRLVK